MQHHENMKTGGAEALEAQQWHCPGLRECDCISSCQQVPSGGSGEHGKIETGFIPCLYASGN